MENKKIVATLVLAALMLLSVYAVLPAKADSATFTVTDVDTGSTVSGNAGDTLSFGGT
jgi:hypothetical protein